MTPDVLIINSYAGSLVLAATQLGLKVRGSYEDAGFGLRTQRLNFPGLRYVEKLPWPDDDLSGTIVIAHPPCAAFSHQNNSNDMSRRGAGTEAFACTKRVMEYALSHGCQALAIESVCGALEGGRQAHDEAASKYGYQVFRILQNAVTFGVPQWRPRFWVVFSNGHLALTYQPQVVRLSAALLPTGTPIPEPSMFWKRAAAKGWPRERVLAELLNGDVFGRTLEVAVEKLRVDEAGAVAALDLRGFRCAHPRVLNPEEVATTLMQDSWWVVLGRVMYQEEYCQVMGFPADYKFHQGDAKQFRMYLSKGVCPPVAKWLLANLTGLAKGEVTHTILPGYTLDLRPKRGELFHGDRG